MYILTDMSDTIIVSSRDLSVVRRYDEVHCSNMMTTIYVGDKLEYDEFGLVANNVIFDDELKHWESVVDPQNEDDVWYADYVDGDNLEVDLFPNLEVDLEF